MVNPADPVNIQQRTLDAIAAYLTDTLLLYMGFGTGNTPVSLTSDDVATPVSVETGVRNLARRDITLNGNFFKAHFVLTQAMPVTQPSDIQQVAIHDGEDDTSGMFFGHTFRVALTKTTDSQWDIWVSGKVVEIERVS